MQHTLSILMQNESGALARVAGMFAARHCNIDSLNVAPTEDPSISQLTVVMQGDSAMHEQIVRQTRKLIDVIDVITLAPPAPDAGSKLALAAAP